MNISHKNPNITRFSIQTFGQQAQFGDPEITFEKLIHDYGTIEQGSIGKYKFIFTNTGTAPLLIEKAIGTCGCTVPE